MESVGRSVEILAAERRVLDTALAEQVAYQKLMDLHAKGAEHAMDLILSPGKSADKFSVLHRMVDDIKEANAADDVAKDAVIEAAKARMAYAEVMGVIRKQNAKLKSESNDAEGNRAEGTVDAGAARNEGNGGSAGAEEAEGGARGGDRQGASEEAGAGDGSGAEKA